MRLPASTECAGLITTEAPSADSRRAMASPMPLLDPVTRATLLENSPENSLIFSPWVVVIDAGSASQFAIDFGDLLRQLPGVVDHRVMRRAVELRQVVGTVAVDGHAVAADALFARFEQGAAGVLDAIAAAILVAVVVGTAVGQRHQQLVAGVLAHQQAPQMAHGDAHARVIAEVG